MKGHLFRHPTYQWGHTILFTETPQMPENFPFKQRNRMKVVILKAGDLWGYLPPSAPVVWTSLVPPHSVSIGHPTCAHHVCDTPREPPGTEPCQIGLLPHPISPIHCTPHHSQHCFKIIVCADSVFQAQRKSFLHTFCFPTVSPCFFFLLE